MITVVTIPTGTRPPAPAIRLVLPLTVLLLSGCLTATPTPPAESDPTIQVAPRQAPLTQGRAPRTSPPDAARTPSGADPARPQQSSEATPTAPRNPEDTEEEAHPTRFPSPLIISVLYFEDRAGRPELLWLRKGLADMLVAALSKRPDLIVVQRERLDEVIREQALQHSGRIADDAGVSIGHMLGATILVTGSLSVVGNQLRLESQLIGVERGAVLGTATAEGAVPHAAAVAADLVERVVGLLPGGGAPASAGPASTSELFDAVREQVAGDELSREGKLWQALEAYERALARAPSYRPARQGYGRILDGLTGWQLLQIEGEGTAPSDQQRLHRLAERVAGRGLDVQSGQPRIQAARRDAVVVQIPVTLRVAPAAIDALREAGQAMGGHVFQSDPEGPLDVVPSSNPEFNHAFVEAISRPRRLYLRLLGRGGRTLGVYSEWRTWDVLTWVHPLDEQTIRIERQRILTTRALFPGLTPQQVRDLTAVKFTVDEVPAERGTVSLDVRAPSSPRRKVAVPESEPSAPRGPESNDISGPTTPPGLEPLRALIETAWNPPVSERPWARGHLPGNERRAVIGLTLDPHTARLGSAPRIVRSSGDPFFDKAAIAATREGLGRWDPGPPVTSPPLPRDAPPAPRPKPVLQVVRVQFQLIKDIPALNLIEAHAHTIPLTPVD